MTSKRLPIAFVLVVGVFGLLAEPIRAQQPLPFMQSSIAIGALDDREISYRVNLDNLPARPTLVLEAIPSSGHEAIQLQVRLENWSGIASENPGCPDSTSSFSETALSGPVRLDVELFDCSPDPDDFNSAEVDVVVRLVEFGPGGLVAKFGFSVYGITQVPTNTQLFEVEGDLSQETISLSPSKDTTIYLNTFDASNGEGTLLWAGAEVEFVGSGPFGFWSRRPRRPLLAFNLVDNLPFNAQVDDADLRLYANSVLGGGGPIAIYAVAPSPTGTTWAEGNAQATGSQFGGASSSAAAADWMARRSGTEDWTTPGGDFEGAFLSLLNVTDNGYQTFSSPQLDTAVQTMLDTGTDRDGFLMTGPGTSIFDFADRGVSFFSNEAFLSLRRPTLTVAYTPSEPYSEGEVNADTLTFVGEGDDFRWIYDDDEDDIVITDIGGICEVVNTSGDKFFPYTYSYPGPAYTGLDCCTWQIDGEEGTVGTGQALFFHNLNASDPANYPPDTDGDGIVDLCDNCVAQPNGPVVGTCTNGSLIGDICNSDLDCEPGAICNLSQQDTDLDGFGNACPEPSFGLGLMLGGALLIGLTRRSHSWRLDEGGVQAHPW